MRRLFVGNFDFERQLATGQSAQRGSALELINDELASAWIALAEDGDLLWTPAPIDAAFFESLAAQGLPRITPVSNTQFLSKPLELVPWGWTDAIRAWGVQHGFTMNAPPQDVVRKANSREFSFQMEQEWGVGLTAAGVIRSLADFERLCHALPPHERRWVVKAEFSMAARERIVGSGEHVSQQSLNWIDKRLRRDETLFFEPWILRLEEVGLQFSIPKSEPPVFEAAVPLLTDQTGNYRGSRFHHDPLVEERWHEAIESGIRLAQHLQHIGYFGPLGIDAVRYKTAEGQVRVRPLQDINARHTMGRLSIGLRRLLSPEEFGTWLHLPLPDQCTDSREWLKQCESRLPAGTRLIVLSPQQAGNRLVRRLSLVMISGCEATQRETEELLAEAQLRVP